MRATAIGIAVFSAFLFTLRREPPGRADAAAPAPVVTSPPAPLPIKPQPKKKAPASPAPPVYELVRPAPKGFKPVEGRKVELKLIPEREYVSRGRSFWYRLEMQNMGRQTLQWDEKDSFFEDGYLRDANVRFLVTQPDGREVRMQPPLDDYGAERDGGGIRVRLKSGETLVSRPWAYQGDGVGQVWGPFRELASRYNFTFLGRYKIKAVLNREALGLVESNEVEFDVVP